MNLSPPSPTVSEQVFIDISLRLTRLEERQESRWSQQDEFNDMVRALLDEQRQSQRIWTERAILFLGAVCMFLAPYAVQSFGGG